MTAREDAGLDLDALEAVANDVLNDEEAAPHAFDVFVTDADEAFWNGITPEVVLALIARVRAAEATVERVRRVVKAEIGWDSPAVLIDRIEWALEGDPS